MAAVNSRGSFRIDLRNVFVTLGRRDVLAGVDLHIAPGESVAIIGPSGSGKTTLLHVLLGLIQPTSGQVEVCGKNLGKLSDKALRAHRAACMSVIFQFGELLPELSPIENVVLPAWFAGSRGRPAEERAEGLLRTFGIDPGSGIAETLSGGERQRVAIARALMNEPQLLLADEPTGALDAANSDQVADALFGLPPSRGTSLLVVTHDHTIASRADRSLVLSDGVLKNLQHAEE